MRRSLAEYDAHYGVVADVAAPAEVAA
jgi:hypothetical protein